MSGTWNLGPHVYWSIDSNLKTPPNKVHENFQLVWLWWDESGDQAPQCNQSKGTAFERHIIILVEQTLL